MKLGISDKGLRRIAQVINGNQEQARAELANYATLEDAPIDLLDMAAFGINQGLVNLPVDSLSVVYEADLENAEIQANEHPRGPEGFAQDMDFSEPIEVKLKDGLFRIEDGHHRYLAATILGKETIEAELTIDDNPIKALQEL